jgi:predicted amidophosphoribosyltransferase
VTAFYYDGAPRRGILRYKEMGKRENAPFWGQKMAARLLESGLFERREDGLYPVGGDFPLNCIVPVPMTGGNAKDAFDHSGDLAREAGKLLDLPVRPLLEKVQEIRPQKELSAVRRSGNVLGAFDLQSGESVAGLRILLVDDVITTGSTLGECAKMLKLYGAETVYGMTVSGT